jgi:hypothetical protein
MDGRSAMQPDHHPSQPTGERTFRSIDEVERVFFPKRYAHKRRVTFRVCARFLCGRSFYGGPKCPHCGSERTIADGELADD